MNWRIHGTKYPFRNGMIQITDHIAVRPTMGRKYSSAEVWVDGKVQAIEVTTNEAIAVALDIARGDEE